MVAAEQGGAAAVRARVAALGVTDVHTDGRGAPENEKQKNDR